MKIQNEFSGQKIWVTGHNGMLGSAMVRGLKDEHAVVLVTGRKEVDLTNQSQVYEWMENARPDYVMHIAAKVGGIHANATYPADFIRENLLIQTNVIDAAHRFGVQKLVFVASNCTYPNNIRRAIVESDQLTGALDQNIRSYAVSKIAGIEMCRAYRHQYGSDFVAVIPPNLYGPGDNYHPENSHVVAGILRRAHEAKIKGETTLKIWGDGTPRRELLHVDDLADAIKHIALSKTEHDLYNIGSGYDLSIREIAETIASVVDFQGALEFDTSKPNGTMNKLLDSSRVLSLGWSPRVNLADGLRGAYRDYMHGLNSCSTRA